MTIRQKVLKALYPLWMFFNKLSGRRSNILRNEKNIRPLRSFYELSAELNDGTQLNFGTLRGKKVLIVNTASDCGYTAQYQELQKLFEHQGGKLWIIAFPANDFENQEERNDDEIAQFCKRNYGISFPLAKKSHVIPPSAKNHKGSQNEVFKWLSDKSKNGWNQKQPPWNFTKYLINEEGVLINYFDPGVSPLSMEVIREVSNKFI